MAIFLFVIIHWYLSLFFQSVFHHRYAAHGHFTMSRGWEKVFYFGCFLTQGSSYISAYAYGLMHRLHHAHTDTPEDPHSPQNTANLFTMMWQTRNNYIGLYKGTIAADEKYKKGLPEWKAFEDIVHNWFVRVLWIALYVIIYAYLATAWWQWLFFPLTIAISSFQGVAVNWWAHRFGYENHSMDNTSKNILPFDFLLWGEAYHNNHHKYPGKVNNANKWYEWDMGYQALRVMNKLRIIRLNPSAASS
jgi:stearoyl-CoA desaturase (Delta-9 desaturase)